MPMGNRFYPVDGTRGGKMYGISISDENIPGLY